MNNTPAFPLSYRWQIGDRTESCDNEGMTLRAYIATKALQGMLAADCEDKMAAWSNPAKAATWAAEFADALMAELEKPATDPAIVAAKG